MYPKELEFEKSIPSWKIGLGDLSGELTYITPDCMEHQEKLPDGVRWRGHVECGRDFQVEIHITHLEQGLFSGKLSYAGYTGKRLVEEIHFPVVKKRCNKETKILYAGYDLGRVIQNEFWKERCFPCHTTSLFALLYPDQHGFYLDTRCSDFSPKHVLFQSEKDHAVLGMVHIQSSGKIPASSWTLSGECVFGSFHGSWYEAARIYRKWAITQTYFTRRIKENPLRKLGVWIWNRGNADDVIPPVLELHKELPDVPIALDWYWWHHNPYDTDYPDYWPPRDGEQKFRDAIKQLKHNHIFTQVYMNGVCWDMNHPSWTEGGSKEFVAMRDGKPRSEIFNRYTGHRLAWMCGEAPCFHKYISEQTRRLHSCGLSGQYLDMISCASNYPCYNRSHHHDLGGGSFMTNGYRRLLTRLKEENPDFPLTSEGCGEAYMDLLDGVIICSSISLERMGGTDREFTVPVFPAIYHGKNSLALFGNYALPDGIPPWDKLWPEKDRWPEKEEQAWHRICPEQFFIEMMRNVIYGTQPMVCNLTKKIYTDPEFRHIWRFIVHITRFYYENISWLFDGEMLSPDGMECVEKEVKFMNRTIFTTPENFKITARKMPVLLHSVYRSPEGKEALFAANYTMQIQEGCYRGKYFSVPPATCLRINLDELFF